MERFSHRESVLLGYSPQKLLMNSSSSPKSPYRNSDIDFNDVFGGPPRRSSMPEIADSVSFKGDDEKTAAAAPSRSSWSGLTEKPVFGEEGVNRRHYPSQDFFDDIFKGSLTSSPRKHDRDSFSSAPGSRALSPALPLPPKAEPFGSSVPPQFSLPAKLSKGMDLPIFGSSTRSQSKYKDGAPNGTSSYSYSPLSRFSSQANQGQDSRNDVGPSYRQSPLLQELSLSSEESSNFAKSDETDTGGNAKKDSSSSEVSINGSQFHFSIYKWATKGVPLVMPLRGGKSSRLKEIKTERCSSSNGRIESMARELSTETSHDIDVPSSNNRISASTESFRMECDKKVNDSLLDTSTQDSAGPCQIVEETILPTSDTETLSNLKSSVKNVSNTVLQDAREQTKPHSLPESAFSEKTQKENSVTPKETKKPELKTLFSFFIDNDDNQDIDEITGKAKGKESTVKSTKKPSFFVDVGKSIKKQDGKRTTSDNREVDKARLQGSHAKSGDIGKNSVKGKVKEFVKLFNQEASSKPKFENDSQRQSFRRKERGTSRAESEVSISTSGTNEKMSIPNVNAKKTKPDAPIMVDDYFKQPEKQQSDKMKTNYLSNDTSSGQKDTSASTTASISNGSKAKDGDTEESFHGNFMIKELNQDDYKLPQTGDDPEDIQVIDTKIRQWSYGKEGNIRSLLSTLQYVLWPESGWKPVPLVDIIEVNAVKRSYQKALLCLHPDKLQQKGAASHQKYIAEKVFDILQDAWTHFNSLGSL